MHLSLTYLHKRYHYI